MSYAQRVCVESPLKGDVERNIMYADACMLDCFARGEAPFLGHRFYPFVLDDDDERDRERGIAAHLAWLRVSELVAVYVDLGISGGMRKAILLARQLELPVIERTLGHGWLQTIGNKRPTQGFRA